MHVSLCADYMNVTLPPEANDGRDSSVGIATRYSVGGPCFETRWMARLFGFIRTSFEIHPTSCTVTVWCLSEDKAAGSNMGRALPVPLLPLCTCLACNRAAVFVNNSRSLHLKFFIFHGTRMFIEVKGEVHPCTGTGDLYRLYGPQLE
jgi:hypothetical protein